MVKWLRNGKVSMVILTLMRIYLGYMWFMDGLGKVTKGFDAKGFIAHAIAQPVKNPEGALAYPHYTAFLKAFAMPNVNFFNFAVSWGELLVGLGLILGTLTTAASFFGILMNLAYIMAGTVSVNAVYVIFEIFFLMAGVNAGKIGLDRWVIPFLRRKVPFLHGDPTLENN